MLYAKAIKMYSSPLRHAINCYRNTPASSYKTTTSATALWIQIYSWVFKVNYYGNNYYTAFYRKATVPVCSNRWFYQDNLSKNVNVLGKLIISSFSSTTAFAERWPPSDVDSIDPDLFVHSPLSYTQKISTVSLYIVPPTSPRSSSSPGVHHLSFHYTFQYSGATHSSCHSKS